MLVAIRFYEFTQLNVRWDQNAYGSVTWLLLGLHATHIITDLGDTLVLTALMFTRHAHGKRFSRRRATMRSTGTSSSQPGYRSMS